MRAFLATILYLASISASEAFAATFTVTTTGDSGAGSLRDAITSSNSSAGPDQIRFNVSGGGPQTITVTSVLPDITDAVVIDATTQPGFTSTPIITLDGNGLPLDSGLTIRGAAPSTIRGLAIVHFGQVGISVAGGGATIVGNYIGVNASGSVGVPNGQGGISVGDDTDGVVIGGSVPQDRNVISGNGGPGIRLGGTSTANTSDDNVVQGNIIGLDASGANAVANNGIGILINGGSRNRIGGLHPGEGNVISGNQGGQGVFVSVRFFPAMGDAIGNVIQGNRIGTDITGTLAVPNSSFGIAVFGTRDTTIGGDGANGRNIVSGNGDMGIAIGVACNGNTQTCVQASHTSVVGNFIGTNANGTAAIPNVGNGINIRGAANTTIGGDAASLANVISGNRGAGILSGGVTTSWGSEFPAVATTISSNLIGTDVNGTTAIPNATGITVVETQNTTISGNVISGNGQHGIELAQGGLSSATSGNTVKGNRIGTDATGSAPLPNGGAGVIFTFDAAPTGLTGNIVGGMGTGEGNVIRFNGLAGILAFAGNGNRFLGNSIDQNAALGIDLAGTGVNPNDPMDADAGPNHRQNFPQLTAATISASTQVTGTLNSTPSRTFRIEFFSSPAADPSGFGEGRTFLGFTNVTTGSDGNANINAIVTSVPGETVITATATDLTALDTSEFSNAVTGVLVPTAIPVLPHWALGYLAALLAIVGALATRR